MRARHRELYFRTLWRRRQQPGKFPFPLRPNPGPHRELLPCWLKLLQAPRREVCPCPRRLFERRRAEISSPAPVSGEPPFWPESWSVAKLATARVVDPSCVMEMQANRAFSERSWELALLGTQLFRARTVD